MSFWSSRKVVIPLIHFQISSSLFNQDVRKRSFKAAASWYYVRLPPVSLNFIISSIWIQSFNLFSRSKGSSPIFILQNKDCLNCLLDQVTLTKVLEACHPTTDCAGMKQPSNFQYCSTSLRN